MRSAKDYKNTIEFAAEKVHNAWMKQEENHGRHAPINCPHVPDGIVPDRNGRYCENCHWDMYPYSELIEDHKDYDRDTVVAVLNAVNYFESKACSDCGYFDPIENICFGEDREHKEQPDSPICETFAPKGFTEDK